MSSRNNAATVQGTNDSSILSKHAMVEAGYALDPFLQVFTRKKAPRRAPLINRGYYIRTKAIDGVIRDFLSTFGRKQIVSLGAGFDTTCFRLTTSLETRTAMDDVYYVEVDFPEVAQRKKDLIALSDLQKYITDSSETSNFIKLSTTNYCLIGADLGDIFSLQSIWSKHTRLEKELPTLLLSECVMTYMDHELSTSLIKFCRNFFPNSLFVTYEQVEPLDAFGLFMRKHFGKLNSSLKGISVYSDKRKQVSRYVSCGYESVDAFSMKEFYDSLPRSEKDRVNQLEYFDEYEEWNLKCFHYVLVLARSNSSLVPQLERNISHIEQHKHARAAGKILSSVQEMEGSQQFSHASCVVKVASSKVLLTHGGFGVENGRHCRQTNIRYFFIDQNGLLSKEHTVSDKLPSRLHHTLTGLSNSRVLVFGGRLSPSKPISQSTLLHLSCEEGGLAVNLEALEGKANEPCPRWRHTATHICLEGEEYVFIAGGLTARDKCRSPSTLSTCHLFNVKCSSWIRLPDLPQAIHSHATSFDGSRYVYVVGGLDGSDMVSSSVYLLDLTQQDVGWSCVTLPIEPVYSHCLHIIPDKLVIVGGIGCSGQQMNLQIMKLSTHSLEVLTLPETVDDNLRMYFNHTSHLIASLSGSHMLYIVGGGGNCFSFGTHINDFIACYNVVL